MVSPFDLQSLYLFDGQLHDYMADFMFRLKVIC